MEKMYNYLTDTRVMWIFILTIVVHYTTSEKTSLEFYGSQGFIYSGHDAKPGQFPYMVSILFEDDNRTSFGSGSLVSKSSAITTSQIFHNGNNSDPTKCSVVSGVVLNDKNESEASQRRMGKEIKIHEDSKNHDIAIVVVQEPFDMNEFVGFAYIAEEKLLGPTECTIVGYGRRSDSSKNRLLGYSDSIIVRPVSAGCRHTRRGDFYCHDVNGTQHSCSGDIGGPLVCKGLIYGLLSFGVFAPKSNHSCANIEENLYVDLSAGADFLRRNNINLKSNNSTNEEIPSEVTEDSPPKDDGKGSGMVWVPAYVILVASSLILIWEQLFVKNMN